MRARKRVARRKMELPHLVECRNITYEEALQFERAHLERMVARASSAKEAGERELRVVLVEMEKWPLKESGQ